jgi:hypothetical protein
VVTQSKSFTLTVLRSVVEGQFGTLMRSNPPVRERTANERDAEVARGGRDEQVPGRDEGLAEEGRDRRGQVGHLVGAGVEVEDPDRAVGARRDRGREHVVAVDEQFVVALGLVTPPLLVAVDDQVGLAGAGVHQRGQTRTGDAGLQPDQMVDRRNGSK